MKKAGDLWYWAIAGIEKLLLLQKSLQSDARFFARFFESALSLDSEISHSSRKTLYTEGKLDLKPFDFPIGSKFLAAPLIRSCGTVGEGSVMKIRVVISQPRFVCARFVCDRLKTGAIATPLIALSALILSGCSVADLPSGKVDAVSPAASANGSGTPIAASPSPTAGEFSFPSANCGDQASTPSENWYPVYIDHGSLDEIHSKFCGDAISAIRDKTGTPSVQVASFTSYGKAQRFALAVGGVVEAIPTAQSPTANTTTADRTASSSASIAAASPQASAPAWNFSGHSDGTQTGTQSAQSATLAADSGSPINIRSSASTTATVATVGYGGDRLQIVDKKQGDDGYTWYSVRLASGETGWVRGDFVSQATASSAANSSSCQ